MPGTSPKPRDKRLRYIGARRPRSLQRGEDALNLDDDEIQFMVSQAVKSAQGAYLPLSGGTISGNLTINGGSNIILDTGTGTQIGTASAQKIGFFGATPVGRPATVADPAGGSTVDAEARTAINALIDRLQELGLIA